MKAELIQLEARMRASLIRDPKPYVHKVWCFRKTEDRAYLLDGVKKCNTMSGGKTITLSRRCVPLHIEPDDPLGTDKRR